MSAPGSVISQRPVSRGRTGPLPQLAVALATGGYATGAVVGWGSPWVALVMGDFGLAAAALVAAASCFCFARSSPGHLRPAWYLFAFSSAMAGAGNLTWGWYEVVLSRQVPAVSAADYFFLLFAPPAIVGLLVLAKRPVTRAGWVSLALDAWLIGGSLLTIAWSLALAHTARWGESVTHAALALAYPLLDIVLISMVMALHFRCSSANRSVINAAIAGLALTVLCDALYTSPLVRGHYRSGDLLDAGWFAGSVLLAYAPWAGRRDNRGPAAADTGCRRTYHADRPITGSLTALAPYLAAAVCTLGILYNLIAGRVPDRVVILTACTVVFALVVRQGITLLDNIALTRELAQQENHFRSLVQSSSDVIMIAAPTGVLQYVSPAAAGVYGIGPEELVGRELASLIHPEDLAGVVREVRRFLAAHPEDEPTTRIECRFRAGNGRPGGEQWLNVESTVNRHHGGLILNSRDVTERVRLQAQLRHNAEHDPLTDLPNRAVFTERVRQVLGGRRTTDPGTAVLFIDLDGFKAVNDTIGHQAGDELLIHAAHRLQESVRAGDMAARLGGDEFAALILGDGERDPVGRQARILEVADRLRMRLSRPYRVAGTEARVAASIGVAFAEPGITPTELMRRADLAMYRAKAAGKARVELYSAQEQADRAHPAGPSRRDGPVHHDAPGRRSEDGRRAGPAVLPLGPAWDGEFWLLHQPVVALEGGGITALSAQARWRDLPGALVAAPCPHLGEHIRSAPAPWASARQHTGDDHCDELGRRLLEEAVEQAAARYRAGHPVPVTVRVPPRLLADRDTAEQRLEGLLAGFGLPLGALFLEVSDSDPQVPLEVLERSVVALRRLGVRFVLSGPGGGRGALHALRRLPVDVLRIDRGLVEGITESARCQKITAGLLRIAADLGLQTVAEGVDQPEQAGLLRVMGCTYGQGAAFSGPLDEHRLRRALTRGAYQMPLVPDQRDSSRDAVLTSSFSQVRVGGVMTSGTVGHHLVRSNNETPVPPA